MSALMNFSALRRIWRPAREQVCAYTYVCVKMYVGIYICIYVRMYVCMFVSLFLRSNTNTRSNNYCINCDTLMCTHILIYLHA